MDTDRAKLDPAVVGTGLCLLAAAGYTACGSFLRAVAVHSDPAWVSCIRTLPVVLASLVLIGHRAARGLPAWPPRRLLILLLLTGLFVQIGGNLSYQWALGQVGLAVTAPLIQGTMVVGGALLGRVFLGESVTLRAAIAILVLITGVVFLGTAAGTARISVEIGDAGAISTAYPALAVGAACLAGTAYATVSVVIRRTVTRHASLSATLFVISATGTVTLGSLSLWRLGSAELLSTDATEFGYMLLAGIFNAVAFYSLSKGLQLIPVARVTALTSSQLAMSALVGILFFGEPWGSGLLIGTALMITGLLFVHRSGRRAKKSHG